MMRSPVYKVRTTAIAVVLALSLVPGSPSRARADDLSSADLAAASTVTLSQSSYVWNGSPCMPSVVDVENWSIDMSLAPGTGYEVVGYSHNVNIGTASIILRCLVKGYTGTWSVPFTITAPKAGATVSAARTSDGNSYKIINATTVKLSGYSSKKTSACIGKVTFGGKSFGVTAVAAKAFSTARGRKLKKVTFAASVRSVGSKAFAKCKKLASATLGTGVTGVASKAFCGCAKLKTLTVKSEVLTKAGVRNSLKGSSITIVKCKGISSIRRYLYHQYFSKANCGRKVAVR